MRTVLIGSDFMYNSNGDLVPIEINTNVGWDNLNTRVESNEESLNLTSLLQFISDNGFTKIEYIGAIPGFYDELSKSVDIECNLHTVYGSLTIPDIEDNDTTLIIRSAYDTTAIVDDEYCSNKVNFLNLIKNQSFGSEFAYRLDDGTLVNTIANILDNGNHPNFLLKTSGPYYDKTLYPKLYKVSTQEELNTILNEVNGDYFLMPYYYNPNKLYSNHVQVVRSLNLLFPPNLESLQIGQYHKICFDTIDELPEYDETNFSYLGDRARYLTTIKTDWTPKLEDTDLVEMADGTFKTALDLQVGDDVKTIDIPNPNNVDVIDEDVNYEIDINQLITGSTYSTNKITNKVRIHRKTNSITIRFQDGSTWSDVSESRYLVERDDVIKFIRIGTLKSGDIVILIDTSTPELSFVQKIVNTIERTHSIFDGWVLTVERQHLFLTKSDENNTTSYVAIEHNAFEGSTCFCGGYYNDPCSTCNNATCGKGFRCIGTYATEFGGYNGYCTGGC
jgi:hypothetical protein